MRLCVANQATETLFWRSSNTDRFGFTFLQLIPLTWGEGRPNNVGMFMVVALAPFGPTDLETLAQHCTESKHHPDLPAYVEDWLLHLFFIVHLIEAAQYLSDEHLSPEPLVPLEVGMLEVRGCWRVHSSSYLSPMAANSQRSPSIMGWWFLLWGFLIAEQGSCDKKRREGSSPQDWNPRCPKSQLFLAKSRGTLKLCYA